MTQDNDEAADMPTANAPAADTRAAETPAETEPAAVDWRSDWSDPSRNSAVKVQAMARGKSARALVANRAAIVADAVRAEAPLSQPALERLPAADASLVDATLREAARRLLSAGGSEAEAEAGDDGLDSLREDFDALLEESPANSAAIARAAKYVAERLCAPRDMGAAPATVLRGALLQMAADAEAIAWSRSGGLL